MIFTFSLLLLFVSSNVAFDEGKFSRFPPPPLSPPSPPFKSSRAEPFATGGSLDNMMDQLHRNLKEDGEKIESKSNHQVQQEELNIEHDKNYDRKRSEVIALGVLNLSKRLITDILKKENNKNKYEILSPISLSSALQLALLGAHGETYKELLKIMNLDNYTVFQKSHIIHDEFGGILNDLTSNKVNPARNRPKVLWKQNATDLYIRKVMRYQSNFPNDNEHQIRVANGIFVQNEFKIRNEYEKVIKDIYKSEIRQLDFKNNPQQSAKEINDWVNQQTNSKIKEIVPSGLNPETRVLLTNALYFKAEWQISFIEGGTMSKKFYPEGREFIENFIMTDMMAHGGLFPHYYDEECDCDILGIPYKQNATTMYVIMPKNSTPSKVRDLQKRITAEKFNELINQMWIKTAVILFPKMHLKSSHHLKTNLRDLGLETLFSNGRCDLSVLSSEERHIFSRGKRDVSYKVESEYNRDSSLTMKDLVLRKRLQKKNGMNKKLKRSKRQTNNDASSITQQLENIRMRHDLENPGLFAEEVVHKVDLTINEKGTEGGAATAITLNRSGTNVVFRVDVPFMFVIRHDPTHIPLFYGAVFEPQN